MNNVRAEIGFIGLNFVHRKMCVALKYDVIPEQKGFSSTQIWLWYLGFNRPGCKVAGNGGNCKVEVGLNGSNLYPCCRQRAVNCYSLGWEEALTRVVALLLFDSISLFFFFKGEKEKIKGKRTSYSSVKKEKRLCKKYLIVIPFEFNHLLDRKSPSLDGCTQTEILAES